MWYKFLLALLAIIFLFIVQTTFFGGFDLFLASFNLILIVLVLLISVADFKNVLFFLIVSGLLMDIYSGLPFGLFLLILFLITVILELLVFNFFTNRSFYSLILLGGIATIFYHLFFVIFISSFYFIGWSDFFISRKYWLVASWQLVSTMIILAVCFWLINKISKFFKPTFIQS